jgi:carbonic anhydrase
MPKYANFEITLAPMGGGVLPHAAPKVFRKQSNKKKTAHVLQANQGNFSKHLRNGRNDAFIQIKLCHNRPVKPVQSLKIKYTTLLNTVKSLQIFISEKCVQELEFETTSYKANNFRTKHINELWTQTYSIHIHNDFVHLALF